MFSFDAFLGKKCNSHCAVANFRVTDVMSKALFVKSSILNELMSDCMNDDFCTNSCL